MPRIKRRGKAGSIVVYIGCMFARKSAELLIAIERAQLGGKKCMLIKPGADTRTNGEIISRSGARMAAHTVREPHEIVPAAADADVIGIDEAHFFDPSLRDIVLELAMAGKQVFIAGLNADYRGEPWPTMSRLIAVANHVRHETAICVRCGEPANFSQRLGGGTNTIQVGDMEYEPRCLDCYEPPRPSATIALIAFPA